MRFISFLLFLVLFIAVNSTCAQKRYEEAALILKGMTLEQKIGQMIMVSIPGKKLDTVTRRILKEYIPGGIILFGYNLSSKEADRKFIDILQKESMKYAGIPLFISIDQEGGRVKRITDGVTQFPGNMALGVVADEEMVYDMARILGIELRRVGINMNLTPVVDVNNNPDNPVINNRSFGSRPEIVSKMGVAYIRGIQRSRCVAVAKHFPGHGDTDKDSHLTLPVIRYTMQRLEKIEFKPFIESIDTDVEAVMTAHIAFPDILKNNLPATLSKYFLTDILRKKMHFGGLIISDDLEMDAISELMDLGTAAVKSINAGADIVLISSYGKHIPLMVKAIKKAIQKGQLPVERINQSVKRILEVKLRYHILGYSKNRISVTKPAYSTEELGLLSSANKLNQTISRKAIYLYGNINDMVFKKIGAGNIVPVIVTSSAPFRKIVRPVIKNIRFAYSVGQVEGIRRKNIKGVNKKGGGNSIVLFYHVAFLNKNRLKHFVSYAARKSVPLVVLATGNPFELSRVSPLPPVLFTFSNTEESQRQLARCIRGEFSARKQINVNLGLKKQ